MEKIIWLLTEGYEDEKLRPAIRTLLIASGFAICAFTDTIGRLLF